MPNGRPASGEAPAYSGAPKPLRGEIALLLGLFAVSRAAFRGAGVRFNAEPMWRHWHFIDPEVLDIDLWGSLWYLHSQPPAMNLLSGLTRLAFPGREAEAFGTLYAALGLAMLLAFWRLLLALGVPRALRLLFAGAWAVNPNAALYESALIYTHPCAALLTLSGLAAWSFFLRGGRAAAGAWAALWIVLAMTRSLFHCVFLMPLGVGMMALRRFWGRGRLGALAALILLAPALAGAAWNAKNYVVFGEFSNSSWLGMSLAKLVYVGYPRAEVERRAKGVLQVKPYAPLWLYEPFFPEMEKTGVPALDNRVKTASGEDNYNSLLAMFASRAYARETIAFVKGNPWPLRHSFFLSWQLYFFSPGEYWALDPNQPIIQPYHDRFAKVFYLCFRHDLFDPFTPKPAREMKLSWTWEETFHVLGNVSWSVFASFLATLFWCPWFAWRARRSPDPVQRARGALLLYLSAVALWVAFAGNLLEVGENYRFRFMAEPLCWLALAHFLAEAGKRFFPEEFAEDAEG